MKSECASPDAGLVIWIDTFSGASGAGNDDYRGELRRAKSAISAYMHAQSVLLCQAVVRLDGQYGNGAIAADLAGLAYVMRGKDYDFLALESVQARLAQPLDQRIASREILPGSKKMTWFSLGWEETWREMAQPLRQDLDAI